jgi:hypothetical protein
MPAAPYERVAVAPWLRKSVEDGKEVVRVFREPKQIDNPRSFQEHLDAKYPSFGIPTAEELENGVFYASIDEYRRAQAGEFVSKEQHNGNATV